MGLLAVLAWPPLGAQEVLRGMIRLNLEPAPLFSRAVEDLPQEPDREAIYRAALEEAARYFSAMIYGWSFYYDIGERARNIGENLESLESLGAIAFGDPGLSATDTQVKGWEFCLWTDYRLNEAQRRRVLGWKSGSIRSLQAVGQGPLGSAAGLSGDPAAKQAALEDAARAGIRAALRGSERNRPKAVRGYIALAEFPSYWIDSGRLTVSARFYLEVTEIIPFSAY